MKKDLFITDSYDYHLPTELIAQHPCSPRDHSRLLIVDRKEESLREIQFCELTDFLGAGDSLVFNNTRVVPARLIGNRETGGETEIFLLKAISYDTWEVLGRPGKKLRTGCRVFFGKDFFCEVIDTTLEGTKIVRFFWQGDFEAVLKTYGQMPLPPYIQRETPLEEDFDDYQTVYAKVMGAVAAPTAGLHFTDEMMTKMSQQGVDYHYVTLHVGLGTFRPVQTEDIREHAMHTEPIIIDEETALALNSRPLGKRQICVGTTCCRSLESAADKEGKIIAGNYETNIFIYPGYSFKYVQALLTNFHAPRSTLLMLVSAFAGYELIMEAYQKAVKDRFRFHSYGDAMLIL